MNLQRIEVHQLGHKVGEYICAPDDWSAITDMQTFLEWLSRKTLNPIRSDLLVWLVLVDPDRDGHPEIEDVKVIMPVWSDEQAALIAQGFVIAVRLFHQVVRQQHDSADVEALIRDIDETVQLGTIDEFIRQSINYAKD